MTLARSITLGRRRVADDAEPYVIAEIGVNHGGSLELAMKLISQAHAGGADAAKFQTYKAELIAAKSSPAYWDLSKEPTQSQFKLFMKYDAFGEAEYRALSVHCAQVGIEFVSTPFDLGAVDFLVPLCPFLKIASADITNYPLLRAVGGHGKPVVMSTGASSLDEVRSAVAVLEETGCVDIALLHCVLSYPTADADAHLAMISGLRDAFPGRVIGYSDHTVPDREMFGLVGAVFAGARIIEKHFTHDKSLPGNDHYHAMDETDLREFRRRAARAASLLGPGVDRDAIPAEQAARIHARRSIVTRAAVRAGQVLRDEHLIAKRPGHGISPRDWERVLGRAAAADLPEDHILRWSDLR